MIKFSLTTLVVSFFITVPNFVFAQAVAPDSVHTKPVQHAIDLYHKTMGTYAHVFNGTEYIGPTTLTEGHPYFLANKFTEGSITYNGLLYSNVSLLYDVVADQVIVKHQDNTGLFNQIKVEKDRVSGFSLSGHRFIRSEGNPALKDGFYDELYKGNSIQLLSKRNKYAKMEVVVMTYKDMDSYLIQKDGQYHTVRSRASVLNVFKDRKKELKKYLRDYELNFQTDREFAMVKLAAYYDTLNN